MSDGPKHNSTNGYLPTSRECVCQQYKKLLTLVDKKDHWESEEH